MSAISALKSGKNAVRQRLLRSRDILNLIRYGRGAPRYAERIWIDPKSVRYALHGPGRPRACSGKVTSTDGHLRRVDLLSTPRISSCIDHWVGGVPWEDTRDYAVTLMAVLEGKRWADSSTEQELLERYRALDRTFQETRKLGRLKTRQELDPRTFREEGGVLICIAKGGEPLLYSGFHRFSIALILELPLIPAQLGYVDPTALHSLERFRSPPASVRLLSVRSPGKRK
jgi:hypothetical protein